MEPLREKHALRGTIHLIILTATHLFPGLGIPAQKVVPLLSQKMFKTSFLSLPICRADGAPNDLPSKARC